MLNALLMLYKFLSTLSLRRATHQTFHVMDVNQISIHALLAESDNIRSSTISGSSYFYPRSPCGERPKSSMCRISSCVFLSTLSLRRATAPLCVATLEERISIHALLAESDSGQIEKRREHKISIHALLAESDGHGTISKIWALAFLSTLSLRRATVPHIKTHK